MRNVYTHSDKSLRFTDHAKTWCIMLNTYKRMNPDCTFKEMAKEFSLSETSIRRYYYGIHHKNGGYFGESYSQVRQGASVPLYELV